VHMYVLVRYMPLSFSLLSFLLLRTISTDFILLFSIWIQNTSNHIHTHSSVYLFFLTLETS
jgi:hypothetical protein